MVQPENSEIRIDRGPSERRRVTRRASLLSDERALGQHVNPLAKGCSEDPVELFQQFIRLEACEAPLLADTTRPGARTLQSYYLFR